MGTSKRERQKAARQAKIEELRVTEQKQKTKRRGLFVGLGVVAFVAFVIIFSVVTSDGDDDVATDDGTDTSEPVDDPTSDPDGETTDPADDPVTDGVLSPSEVQPGPTECPPVDGVDEPVIDFDGPFQKCIEDGVDYQARFTTTEGVVLIDLLEDTVPNTVNNFVALARYGYYDNTKLFRTDPSIDIIQGGSPHTNSASDPGPGYTIPDEPKADYAADGSRGPFSYEAGQLIMARSGGPDASGAQFFFSTGPNVSLLDSQGTYILFGDVIEGLDVLQTIIGLHEDDPSSGLGGGPSRDVTVESVEIVEA